MKIIIACVLTALLAFVLGLFLPWWSIAIAAFGVAALIPQKALKAFLSGFLGVFILWGGLAWWIDINNQGILSKKIAELMQIPGRPLVLILATGLIGGLVAGVAALSGSFLRQTK